MFEKEELKRYNRQIILSEMGLAGQVKLKTAKVLMIGAGALGCSVLQYLVAAGVGHIGIVDDDCVAISNLHRQILYSINDLNRLKVIVAKEKLEILNPYTSIAPYPERLTSGNADQICAPYDLVIDGSDNFPTRYLVNDTCVSLNKPLIFGSILKFEGQVSVFNWEGGPNYRDLFPEAPPDGEVGNCSEIGVIGVLPGIIGAYMANEAIKIICGIGENLSGKLMRLNTLENTNAIFKIPKKIKVATVQKTTTVFIVNEINRSELENLIAKFNECLLLIDVRENYEFEDYNIGGLNIPINELSESINEFSAKKILVFCCQTGLRSKMAIQMIRALYDGEMYSLKNGIVAHG